MLTLFCLGDLRLELDGERQLAGRRKPLALLAFLSRRGERRSSREELAELFWGAGDAASGRKSLRQCLSELRAVPGLVIDETEGGIALGPGTTTDVVLFEADLRAGRWEAALDRWSGHFIALGDQLGDAGWQSWLDGERVALRRELGVACEHITTRAETRGDWKEVVRVAERWRTLLPDDGRAWAREIHALQYSRRMTDAIARHADAERHFVNTLGIGLPPEIAKLGRVLKRINEAAGATSAPLLSPDLVGRGEVLTILATARHHLRSAGAVEGRTLFLTAPERLGKSRFLREFARQSHDSDARIPVIQCAAFGVALHQPYALVESILGELASQEALAGCPPESLAVLATISPRLSEHFRHLPAVDAPAQQDVAVALARALTEVASDKGLVLLLDDLPNADRESLDVLASLLLRPPARALIVASGRMEAWSESAVAGIAARADPSNRLTLELLSATEVKEAIASMAPLSAATLAQLGPTIHHLTGGVPGDVTSLMMHAVTSGSLVRDASEEWSLVRPNEGRSVIPAELVERWRDQYGRLPADVRQVVDAIAVVADGAMDEVADLSLTEQVVQLDPGRFRSALEQLQQSGVVRSDDGTVAFVSGAQRLLTYEALPPSARMRLHGETARLLRRDPNFRSNRAAFERHRRAGRPGGGVQRRVVAASLVAFLAVGAWVAASVDRGQATAGTPVVLADVQNLTGDSAFDRTLFLAARVGLQQSRQVSVFPRSRVREILVLMQRPGEDSLFDEALAREVALRQNLRRVVALAVSRLDSVYLVSARIVDARSGRDVFAAQQRVDSRAGVLGALELLLVRIRREAGEPEDSLQRYNVPLPQVTTGSLAALQSYAGGLVAFTDRRYEDAYTLYRRAVELDSTFALAWLGLANLRYERYGDRQSGDSALAQAERFASRLTEREQLQLERAAADYRGFPAEALRISALLARRFPERDTWYNYGTSLMRSRRCAEAIPALQRAAQFDVAFAGAHINIATCHQFLGASDSAIAAYLRAHAIDSMSVFSGALNHEFGVALVRAGRIDSAKAVFVRMARRPAPQDQQYGHRSLGYLAGWLGRYREATAQFDSAAVNAVVARTTASQFRNQLLRAEHQLSIGEVTSARATLDSAWALSARERFDPYFLMIAGRVFVRAGQLKRAATMLDSLAARSRAGSADDRTLRAVLAAHIALFRNNGREARALLLSAADTTRNDFSLPVLTDVYIALGHSDSAFATATWLAERNAFGIDAQDAWMRNLLTLGQLAERLGRGDQAREAYGRLETQLSSGDADHPLLIEARRALARLTSGGDSSRVRVVRPNGGRERY